MNLVLDRELDQIKSGWASRSPRLRLSAHGYSPEVADRNLERLVRHFLAPFEREGVLEKKLLPSAWEQWEAPTMGMSKSRSKARLRLLGARLPTKAAGRF